MIQSLTLPFTPHKGIQGGSHLLSRLVSKPPPPTTTTPLHAPLILNVAPFKLWGFSRPLPPLLGDSIMRGLCLCPSHTLQQCAARRTKELLLLHSRFCGRYRIATRAGGPRLCRRHKTATPVGVPSCAGCARLGFSST